MISSNKGLTEFGNPESRIRQNTVLVWGGRRYGDTCRASHPFYFLIRVSLEVLASAKRKKKKKVIIRPNDNRQRKQTVFRTRIVTVVVRGPASDT